MFPFDLPGATLLYLALYLVTLAVHVVFMSYVLAGSGLVTVAALLGRARTPLASVLRDWLPFGLGATITAGVAPLLFLQILYKERFYTASLLLFHRWMIVVPVLILGFYLLYLGKTQVLARWGRRAGVAVSAGAFACFVFTAYSWTEMHLLALDHSAWVELYTSERMVYSSPQLVPRVAMWLLGSVPLMAAIAGWQLWQKQPRPAAHHAAVRALALSALAGLVLSAGAALWYAQTQGGLARAALRTADAKLYLAIAAAGVIAQAAAWLVQARRQALAPRLLLLASCGAGLTVLAAAAVRELLRLSTLDVDGLAALHARAAQVGGMPVFLGFLLINIGVIAWCFRITRRGLRAEP